MDEDSLNELQNLQTTGILRWMIEIIPNGMVVVDDGGHIVLANSHIETIFGYRRDDLLGRPFTYLIPERFRHSNSVFHPQYIANPVPHPIGRGRDMFARRQDGSEVPVEIGLTPVRIPEGLFVLSEIVDITERKRAEAKALRIKEIAAQELERCRLARELHDELGQLLIVISFDLQTAKQICGSDVPRLDDNIRRVDRVIEQVRNLTFDLRPPMLDDLGLVATLRWYADRHLQSAGLVLHFASESIGIHLPSDLATACYRVVQEALANVIRHAQARQVWLEFRESSTDVSLTIRDDGVGFDPDVIRQRVREETSFGLLGMKERVEILGGIIEIRSQPQQGTVIEASIPLPPPESFPEDVEVKGVLQTEPNPSLIG